MQLIVSPVLPSVPKGEPPVLDLYLNPSLEILVLSSRGIVFSVSQCVFNGVAQMRFSTLEHPITQGFKCKCLKWVSILRLIFTNVIKLVPWGGTS